MQVKTKIKQSKSDRNDAIRSEFASLEGMKMAKYVLLAKKYELSRIAVQKIVANK